MKSFKITSKNVNAELKNPEDAVLVRGKRFNELKEDLDALQLIQDTSSAGNGVQLSPNVVQYTETRNITAAMVTGTSAGQLGHADGIPLVTRTIGTGYVVEFVSALLVYDGDGTGYTAGGNVTINDAGGSAITGLVSAANSFGATGDKIYLFLPLTTAATSRPVNTNINLVAASAFTTGGAAGIARVHVTYRLHKTNL